MPSHLISFLSVARSLVQTTVFFSSNISNVISLCFTEFGLQMIIKLNEKKGERWLHLCFEFVLFDERAQFIRNVFENHNSWQIRVASTKLIQCRWSYFIHRFDFNGNRACKIISLLHERCHDIQKKQRNLIKQIHHSCNGTLSLFPIRFSLFEIPFEHKIRKKSQIKTGMQMWHTPNLYFQCANYF